LWDNLNLLTSVNYFLPIDYCKRNRKKYVIGSVNCDVKKIFSVLVTLSDDHVLPPSIKICMHILPPFRFS
jgi:hypothetical protein